MDIEALGPHLDAAGLTRHLHSRKDGFANTALLQATEAQPDRVAELLAKGPLLLTEVSEAVKGLLAPQLGISLSGDTRYLMIRPLTNGAGKTRYHLIESQLGKGDVADPEEIEVPHDGERIDPDADEAPEPSEPQPSGDGALFFEGFLDVCAKSASEVDALVAAETASSSTTAKPDVDWFYTMARTIPIPATAKSSQGFKAPAQDINVSITYRLQAFLEDATSGAFQWLVLETTGSWEAHGMTKNERGIRGWGHGIVQIDHHPLESVHFHQCSPRNANNDHTVTTSIGFDVGYQTATASYSKTTTQNIRDWSVSLLANDNWRFRQTHPFNGAAESFPGAAVKWNASKFRYELKAWPELTRTVFQADTASVWRTKQVVKGEMAFELNSYYHPNYIQIENTPASYKGARWIPVNTLFDHTRHILKVDLSDAS